ncbi:MAG TPA: hypothetical protein VFK73_07865 [Paludibacter sp.]|nr:hypothetical protein [Paludibacter sp.]
MKQFLVVIVKGEIILPGNFESSKKQLKAYCKNEMLDYSALESDLRLFFGLLADYNQTKDPVLSHFLILQACNCFFDEAMFGLLSILPPEEINQESFGLATSATNFGMVGGHLIGL